MKGLSTILAMILIVIITVALIGLTYTFASGLIGMSGTAAVGSTANMTTNLQKTIYISSASCVNNSTYVNLTFTVKATGSTSINGLTHELGAALDGGDITTSAYEYYIGTTPGVGFSMFNSNITAGRVMSYLYIYKNTTPNFASRMLTVSAPGGDMSYTIQSCKV